jgi:hypothetical protein
LLGACTNAPNTCAKHTRTKHARRTHTTHANHTQSLVEYLGIELGELFDTTGILPSDLLADEYDEEDDEAMAGGASSTSGGGGGGGGALDSAAAMMFRPRRLRALKRRYEQLLRVSLQVQNKIDDLATGFERLHSLVTGQDVVATAIFYSRVLALAVVVVFVGGRRVAFAWWCWDGGSRFFFGLGWRLGRSFIC